MKKKEKKNKKIWIKPMNKKYIYIYIKLYIHVERSKNCICLYSKFIQLFILYIHLYILWNWLFDLICITLHKNSYRKRSIKLKSYIFVYFWHLYLNLMKSLISLFIELFEREDERKIFFFKWCFLNFSRLNNNDKE